MTIREAIAADFEEWFRLYDTVAAEGRWIAGEAPSDRAARQRAFDDYREDPDAVTFLAETDGRLVGNLGVQVRRGIANLGMMVDAPWRGSGVGSALMEACIAWAAEHGAHKLILEVWPHNIAALSLYRRYSFEQEGLFKRHYRRRNANYGMPSGWVAFSTKNHPGPLTASTEDGPRTKRRKCRSVRPDGPASLSFWGR